MAWEAYFLQERQWLQLVGGKDTMGLQRDRRGIPLQWHTLRPCRQASMLFTSTLAAHLRIGSGFRVSVQTTQEPLAEAALLDFSKKKKELSFKEKRRFQCVCVCGESGAAGLCCLRFPSAAVCHMRLFLQMSCDGNLATRSPAGAAHPGADPAPGSPRIIGGRGREARESVRSSTPHPNTQVGGSVCLMFIPVDSIARWPWRARAFGGVF